MASDYEQAKRRVDAKQHIWSLVDDARQRSQRHGDWPMERQSAAEAIKRAMHTEGHDLVLEVLVDGFADMIFLERDRLSYRVRSSPLHNQAAQDVEHLFAAYQQATLNRIAKSLS